MVGTRLAMLVGFLAWGATVALAQTTGSIEGQVNVATGGALPLARVEAKGPALQG